MIDITGNTEIEVKDFCSLIGKDPCLVQGAGGNVSWKDNNILWVKASGTSLADASNKDIFVPVDLLSLREAIALDDFNFKPKVIGDSKLRPSIEAVLHGLMSQKVVVHIHSISSLIHLVQENADKILKKLIDTSISWGYVDYFKPGADLARAVSTTLKTDESLEVIFLQNHGIVVGGEDMKRVSYLINKLDNLLGRGKFKELSLETSRNNNQLLKKSNIDGFFFSKNNFLQLLIKDQNLFSLLMRSWALFPDHVVFLGEKPFVVNDENELSNHKKDLKNIPFIFIKNVGILQNSQATNTQIEQLECYVNVILNMNSSLKQRTLSDSEIDELLNWDAEVYRQSISK